MESLSEKARELMMAARDQAVVWKHHYIAPEHLLLAILDDDGLPVRNAMPQIFDMDKLRNELTSQMKVGSNCNFGDMRFSPAMTVVLENASSRTMKDGRHWTRSEDMLLGLFVTLNNNIARHAMAAQGVDLNRLCDVVDASLKCPNEDYDQFFMVFGGHGNTPTAKHLTHDSARSEAERLAKKHKTPFYILKSVAKCSVKAAPVEWKEIK